MDVIFAHFKLLPCFPTSGRSLGVLSFLRQILHCLGHGNAYCSNFFYCMNPKANRLTLVVYAPLFASTWCFPAWLDCSPPLLNWKPARRQWSKSTSSYLSAHATSCCRGVRIAHLQHNCDLVTSISFWALRDQVYWDGKSPHVSADGRLHSSIAQQ